MMEEKEFNELSKDDLEQVAGGASGEPRIIRWICSRCGKTTVSDTTIFRCRYCGAETGLLQYVNGYGPNDFKPDGHITHPEVPDFAPDSNPDFVPDDHWTNV